MTLLWWRQTAFRPRCLQASDTTALNPMALTVSPCDGWAYPKGVDFTAIADKTPEGCASEASPQMPT